MKWGLNWFEGGVKINVFGCLYVRLYENKDIVDELHDSQW